MNVIESSTIYCPYCNEKTLLMIDCTLSTSEYTEDCQVCCQPMLLQIDINPEGDISVNARREND